MPRTVGSLRAEPAARLAGVARERPEWKTWLSLLDRSVQALADPGWRAALNETQLSSSGPEGAPLLHRRTLHVDSFRVVRLIRSLAATASEGDMKGAIALRRYRPSEGEVLDLISAAVRQAKDEISLQAHQGHVDEGALASVAHLATLPLLQSCGHLLKSRLPTSWPHGYCPVCAAWPILAERRGLDRSRRLRCGRCAADWEVQWLYCVYCGERDHKQLGSLEPDDGEDLLKVETCATCRGYLKSIATLQAFPALELLLQDLETVELDLIALNRGFMRPARSGFNLDVQIARHAPS
jgi:FdhE protein